MKLIDTELADVKMIEPTVYGDARGFFFESYNEQKFTELTGIAATFVQDNHSKSVRGVLRGLHYQILQPQGKLVRVVAGEVFDVVVDLRRTSPTFGRHVCATLSDENKRMLWVPPGFAHGFLVTSDSAEFLYKTTDYYAPQHERSLRWNDPHINVPWPLAGGEMPQLKAADANAPLLADAETFA
ncbi:MAG: dTDP-4-dehydrorhamnose 3,5-epimerase [Betaproteobacteria bacterium]|jgi:dTDP-4-dehydrorhamnose 3,5-epimerase